MENNLQLTDSMPPAPQGLSQIHLPHYYGQIPEVQHFRQYWDILRKRKWWVLFFFLGTVLVAGVLTFMATPLYRASTVLQITQDNPAAVIGDRDPFAALNYETQNRFYETQYMILNSRPMAYKIVDSLNLLNRPEYRRLREKMPEKSGEDLRRQVVDQIQASLEIKPLRRSYLVEVGFSSPDKNLTQQVVNIIAREYTKFSMDTRRQSYELIKNWLEGELQLLANKVEDSERRVYEHGQKKDFLAMEEKDNTVVGKYVELNLLVTRAQAERMTKEAQYKEIKARGNNAPLITNNPLIQKLREEIIGQEAKVSSLKRIYGRNYPQLQIEQGKLKELKTRLGDEIKRLRDTIEADFRTAQRAENLLSETFEDQKSRVGELQDNLVKHHILKRDMQTNEQLYQALLARMKETSVASTMVASNVAVITPAELPDRPFRPRKTLNLLLASIVGLVGGVGLALLVEHLDDSIKTAGEMERVCQLPTLGVVPLRQPDPRALPEDQELGLIAYHQPKSMLTEAIRHIRTAIMLSSSGAPPAALMVTSPNPHEGKTTLSINIAISLATNGRKVVLIDGDLRKPTIHTIFQQPPRPGLSNYLSGNAELHEILQPTEIPGLFLIPGGSVPPSPTELLASKAFENLISQLRQKFQHLIIDTPPIIGFADGRALSALVDGVLLIFKHHTTSREAGRLATQLLQQVNARVLGGILNMSRRDRMGYGGYYGYYKYYQKYYQKYHDADQIESGQT